MFPRFFHLIPTAPFLATREFAFLLNSFIDISKSFTNGKRKAVFFPCVCVCEIKVFLQALNYKEEATFVINEFIACVFFFFLQEK